MTNKEAVRIVLLTNGAREELQALASAVLTGKERRQDEEALRKTVIGVSYEGELIFENLEIERLNKISINTRYQQSSKNFCKLCYFYSVPRISNYYFRALFSWPVP